MKNNFLLPAALLAAVVSAPLMLAQDAAAPAATPAPAASVSTLPVVNHLVYLAKLPTPAELMKGAAAQGSTITRIDQTSDSIVVVYQYANGRTDTFGYTLLSAATTLENGAPVAVQPGTPAPAPTVVYAQPVPQTTTVVYRDPETVYYTPRYVRYYDPVADFWGPLALGVGIGWIGGHDSWHGGWHGRGGWRHH